MTALWQHLTAALRGGLLRHMRVSGRFWPAWTWWFCKLLLLAVILGGFASFALRALVVEGADTLAKEYPGLVVDFSNGKLAIEGVTLPLVVEGEQGEVFIVDTQGVYDLASAKEKVLRRGGLYVGSQQALIYNDGRYEEIPFTAITENIRLTASEAPELVKTWGSAVVLVVFTFVALAVMFGLGFFLLGVSLLWAVVYFVVGRIASVKNLTFGEVFLVVLFWMPLVVVLSFVTGYLFWLTVLTLSTLFYFEFRHLKQSDGMINAVTKPPKEEMKEVENISQEEKKEEPVTPNNSSNN